MPLTKVTPSLITPIASSNTASAIVQRDSSGNFSAGTITAALSGNATSATTASAVGTGVITNAMVNASAAIVDTKLATISTTGKVSNSATTATTSPNGATIVLRDTNAGINVRKTTYTQEYSFNQNTTQNSAPMLAFEYIVPTGNVTTKTGTYSLTASENLMQVFITGHGLTNVPSTSALPQYPHVYLDFTSGTGVDGWYEIVEVLDANQFNVIDRVGFIARSGNVRIQTIPSGTANPITVNPLVVGNYCVNFPFQYNGVYANNVVNTIGTTAAQLTVTRITNDTNFIQSTKADVFRVTTLAGVATVPDAFIFSSQSGL